MLPLLLLQPMQCEHYLLLANHSLIRNVFYRVINIGCTFAESLLVGQSGLHASLVALEGPLHHAHLHSEHPSRGLLSSL